MKRKMYDINLWPTQLIFYDRRGRRFFTDYLHFKVDKSSSTENILRTIGRRIKRPDKKPVIGIAVIRKAIIGVILEED